MAERLLLTIPPSPDAADFAAVVLAVTDRYPGLMMDAVRQTDAGYEIWVTGDPLDQEATDEG